MITTRPMLCQFNSLVTSSGGPASRTWTGRLTPCVFLENWSLSGNEPAWLTTSGHWIVLAQQALEHSCLLATRGRLQCMATAHCHQRPNSPGNPPNARSTQLPKLTANSNFGTLTTSRQRNRSWSTTTSAGWKEQLCHDQTGLQTLCAKQIHKWKLSLCPNPLDPLPSEAISYWASLRSFPTL